MDVFDITGMDSFCMSVHLSFCLSHIEQFMSIHLFLSIVLSIPNIIFSFGTCSFLEAIASLVVTFSLTHSVTFSQIRPFIQSFQCNTISITPYHIYHSIPSHLIPTHTTPYHPTPPLTRPPYHLI